MVDQLSKLFESTKQLYKSEAEEVINRLLLIKKSGLLDEGIKRSIDPILERMRNISEDIKEIQDIDFKKIHEKEGEIRSEERILELLENAISTFISHRNLSTGLSVLFEDLYNITAKERLPFLVVSREGEAMQTYPSLRNENKKLLVGVIGIPLFSVSHIYEWILAGHEFGHIMANKKLDTGIEYHFPNEYDTLGKSKRKVIDNYKMEILADFAAMQIFGPVFLEALLTEFTGAERGSEFVANVTHPPIPWRINLCYDKSTYFNRRGFYRSFKNESAEEFIKAIESVVSKRYPKDESEKYMGFIGVQYKDLKEEINKIPEKEYEKIRKIEDIINCYKNAYKLSELLQKEGTINGKEFYSDEIVIGGYLASREKPMEFKSYTQKVTDLLMEHKKYS